MTERDTIMMRQVAYVMSQTAAALCRLEGMKALNAERERKGEIAAYTDADFEEIVNDFGLGYNTVMNILNV